jgi:DNA-binding response OmpR family regulator
MRILLIDDDKDICQLTQKVLAKSGYTVDAFYDAKSGINHARVNKPNLILMDIMLPGLSGPEIISSLKAEPYFKNIPVIFLTGLVSGGESLEDEGIMVGGAKYQTLGKPYEIERLLSIVKKFAK